MKHLLQEFQTFAMRGNVLDLAIAVVIGTAFGKIVSSLVDTVIMPVTGLFTGGIDFSDLALTVGGTVIAYGAFLQSVLDFLIIAFVIFLIVKAVNRFKKKEDAAAGKSGESEVALLTEIRDILKRRGL